MVRTPNYQPDAVFASRAGGFIDALRGVFGLPYQPSSLLRFGLVTRTWGSGPAAGSVALDSTLDGGGPSIGASASDGSTKFEYKMPFEFDGGIALVAKRAEVEFDVKGYAAIPSYALLSSDQPQKIYRDPGDKTGGTIKTRPFPSIMTEFRASQITSPAATCRSWVAVP